MSNEITEAVRHTCILATVRLKTLGLTRTDRTASRDVENTAGATSGAARVVVSRLAGADDLHKRIVKALNGARATLLRFSMPYGNDEGWRLLPNQNFDPFIKGLKTCKDEVDALKVELKTQAPIIIAAARSNMGTLDVPVPTVDELIDAYQLEYEFREVAEGSFKGLPDAVSVKLRKHSQAKLEAAVHKATTDTLERFVAPLSHFIERMDAFDQRIADQEAGKDVGRNGVFRDTVVENIKELIEVVDSFNVTGDERIAALAERLAPFAELKPDTLRDNQPERQKAKETVREVLADLNEWLTPGA